MSTLTLRDMKREQVEAFVTWFRERGEEQFRDYCREQGLKMEPYVDGETAPGHKNPEYDGSMDINFYSLPKGYFERIRLERAVLAAFKKPT